MRRKDNKDSGSDNSKESKDNNKSNNNNLKAGTVVTFKPEIIRD